MCLSHWVWNDLEFSLQMKYLCLISSDTQVPISQVVGLLGRQVKPSAGMLELDLLPIVLWSPV